MILSLVALEHGWTEVPSGTKGDIHWVVSPEDLERALLSPRAARVSHIPGMHALCRKAPFAALMRGCAFFPDTIVVNPDEHSPLQDISAALKGASLIVKPDDGTQGDGIHIVCSMAEALRQVELARAVPRSDPLDPDPRLYQRCARAKLRSKSVCHAPFWAVRDQLGRMIQDSLMRGLLTGIGS